MCAMDTNTNRMAPVGQGNINFDAVLAAAEQVGTEYLLVEQDISLKQRKLLRLS